MGGGGSKTKQTTQVQDIEGLNTATKGLLAYGTGPSGLTPEQEQLYQQQLQMIDLAGQGAEQTLSQTARDQATARGLFSSRGAIAQESGLLANLALQQSQARAGILGQRSDALMQQEARRLQALQSAGQLAGITTGATTTSQRSGGLGGIIGAGVGGFFGNPGLFGR